jgi:hypothetical protein
MLVARSLSAASTGKWKKREAGQAALRMMEFSNAISPRM